MTGHYHVAPNPWNEGWQILHFDGRGQWASTCFASSKAEAIREVRNKNARERRKKKKATKSQESRP